MNEIENNLDNYEIEKKISEAVVSTMPKPDFNAVLSKCKESNSEVKIMNTTQKNVSLTKVLLSCAAAIVLLFVGVFAYTTHTNAADYTLVFDVNPGFTIEVNNKNEISVIIPLNEDAQKVLGTQELVGVNFDTAMTSLVASMAQNGYLQTENNTMLLSVKGKENDEAFKNEMLSTVNTILAQNNVTASVLYQDLVNNEDIANLANQNNISEGKAALINRLVAADSTLIPEQLALLSTNDLNLLLNSRNQDNAVTATAPGSNSTYQTAESATNKALAAAGITASAAQDLDTDYDVEDGIMVYEVDFEYNGQDYEYEIDVKTGQIIAAEVAGKDLDAAAIKTLNAGGTPTTQAPATNDDDDDDRDDDDDDDDRDDDNDDDRDDDIDDDRDDDNDDDDDDDDDGDDD